LASLLLLACASTPAGPPVVHWGVDECSHCHMILSEPRYAAVARSANGEEARGKWTIWAHASAGDAWLPAATAWFVPAGAHTPMGSGLLAFADRGAAAAVAPAGVTPLDWQALLARTGARGSHPS